MSTGDGDGDEDDGESFPGLALLEAMGTHFHEHHEAILRWSWKLFCAKWCRLLDWAADEEVKRQQKETEQTYAELRARLEQQGGH